jgi:hypothetical protein
LQAIDDLAIIPGDCNHIPERATTNAKPYPDFDITLDRAGVSKAAFARAAGKTGQTIYAMLNPALLPSFSNSFSD